jgi:hypothetical protein
VVGNAFVIVLNEVVFLWFWNDYFAKIPVGIRISGTFGCS